jgi:PKD repeat protein
MKKWLLILSSAIIYLSMSAQCTSDRYTEPIFPNVTVTSSIQFGSAVPYGSLLPENLYLDLYEPTGDTLAARPLIVYAFGGGFLIGTRIDPPIPAYASYYAQLGYVVASVDYRIGFDVVDSQSAERAVYRGVQDMRGAVRFLCQHYPQYRIDTTEIFMTGSSAGCFSGLHSCFLEQSDWPPCIHGTLLEPSDLGCMDCADNTDNNSTMPQIKGIVSHWGAIFDTTYIRATAKDNVPTICLQGDQDPIVPYNVGPPFSLPIFPNVYGSLPITIRMTDIGIKTELHDFVGYGHEPWLLAPQLVDTCYIYEVPFLYSILQPKPLRVTGDSILCVNDIGSYSVPGTAGSSYCWNVNGGTIVTNTNNAITVEWAATGSHIVTVRELTRDQVNGNLDSFTVDVIAYPVAAFGDSVFHTEAFFSDSSAGAVSWAYNFGDNTGSHLADPIHTYSAQSAYTISLIVSNGYCADTAYRTLTTDTCPSGLSISYTVSGDTVLFASTPAGAGYSWHFGDGDSADVTAPYHIYTHSQNYLVSLWTSTANDCSVYGSVIVPFTAVVQTGISDIGGQAIKIYPNPADDRLYISRLDAAADIILYDLAGQKLIDKKVDSNTDISLDISYLSTGIYSLKIAGQDINLTKMVIKK